MAKLGYRPVAIDLFAGVGGFSLGIEQAGFDVAIAVEKDPIHAAVYGFNFPQTHVLCADVSELTGTHIQKALQDWCDRQKRPVRVSDRDRMDIDLVFGGPPCQGFSVMGKRQVCDKRNLLVFEFCRLIKELQPRYFLMENVPGLGLNKYQDLLNRLQYEFTAAGYEITQPIQVLNAVNFGVPQQRQRLFILGNQVGVKPLTYPQPQLQSPSEFCTVRDAIADLPNLDDFTQLQTLDWVELTLPQLKLLQALAMPYVEKLRNIITDPFNFAHPRQWNPFLLTSSKRTQHNLASIKRFNQTPPGQLEAISRLQRLDWGKPCYTLRAGTGYDRGSYTSPRPIHPKYPRVISVREAARLHSFPDWFRFHVTKWHGFRQVGNAVPPRLGRVLGDQIIAALGVEPSPPTLTLTLKDSHLLELGQVKAFKYWKQKTY
jgi:DNA (cytosine-5)-methyltransferase 1